MHLAQTYVTDTSWWGKLNPPLETILCLLLCKCIEQLSYSLGGGLYKLSSFIWRGFTGTCGVVLRASMHWKQSHASSSFSGSLHANENVNYVAQVSPLLCGLLKNVLVSYRQSYSRECTTLNSSLLYAQWISELRLVWVLSRIFIGIRII